jgi:thimet oligopeptidase
MRLRAPVAALLLALVATACPSSRTTPPPADPALPGAPMSDETPTPEAPAGPPHERFMAQCRQDLKAAEALLERVLAVPGERTLGNTLVPYNHLSVHVRNAITRAGLYANVHPDEAMREAGETCEREAASFITDLGLNRALYEAFTKVDAAQLDADARRLVERTLRDFRRSGVDKDDATRARLKALADRQVELGQTFDRNIRQDVRSVKVDPAQLAGLPEDYVKAHPPGPDGKVTITTDYPSYVPFRQYARDGAARLELYKVYMSRGWPANDEVFKELLAVRKEQATLLGYASWADYVTEDKMIGSAANVQAFIDKISKAADGRAKKDLQLLVARKRKDDPKARSLDQSESLYYEELVKKERFSFDSQEVRPYFEFTRVRDGLLEVTSRLFGVEYEPVKDPDIWHPDVSVYDVRLDGERLGRIYLDLHPRDGKYKHAAQFTLVSGVADLQLPEGVLVCNFPDPSKGPALMEHNEVVTLFHEFGHLLHHILAGRHRWVYFSGVATEWDFVEAPSQMLEEWAWDVKTLQKFARHVETGEPIPEELVKRMRAANEFGKGTHARHQMFYASMSLRYHTVDDPMKLDPARTMVELQGRYSPFRYVPETYMYANFGHLNGYSAMYYTYMWSLVIAKDLFSAFEKAGLYDEETARRYRDRVLARGGAADAAELVRDFLGRDYGFDAFRRWLERN